MTSRFFLLLTASLAAVCGVVFLAYSSNQKALARLEGQILKVRTFPLGPDATLVFADFRITNPAQVPFVVDSLRIELDRSGTAPIEGGILTRRETEQVFAYQKLAGPQYNDPLITRNRVAAGETLDRMTAARFDVPEAAVDARTALRITIREADGQEATIAEAP